NDGNQLPRRRMIIRSTSFDLRRRVLYLTSPGFLIICEAYDATTSKKVLRAADRYAYTGCGSTAYSVGTVYGGKGELYTPDARPALLATPRRFSGHALACFTGHALACLIDDALLALLGLTTETRPTHKESAGQGFRIW